MVKFEYLKGKTYKVYIGMNESLKDCQKLLNVEDNQVMEYMITDNIEGEYMNRTTISRFNGYWHMCEERFIYLNDNELLRLECKVSNY